jgi:hypothetical protein
MLNPHEDRHRRAPHRPRERLATLRRLTLVAVVSATALNFVLFAQTGFGSIDDAGNAALALLKAVLPGPGGIQPVAAPSPGPDGGRPVAVSGGS